LGITRRSDPVKAYVTIIEGCNDHCAFCVVPYTRGHERMRAKADILADVRDAVDSGRREIQLLGQIVNHYEAPDDPTCDFAELLSAVNDVDGVERIRFASPHPRHTGRRLIEAVRDLPKVCKHLHLPVQSGSSRILKAMRRRYTRESYLELVSEIREAIPGVALSTDMIVGFPGEDAHDFEQTLSLTETVRYHSMFSFKYSQRPNTLASKRMPDNVRDEEKTSRIVALQSLQRQIQTQLHEQAVGSTVEVLVDSRGRRQDAEISGRTSGNTVVNCAVPEVPAYPDSRIATRGNASDWIGRTVDVRILRAGPHSLWVRPWYQTWKVRRGEGRTNTMLIEMTIKGLMVDPVTNMPIVILKDKQGDRVLPIWVGIFEANAIALQIENVATPRPMTHDLLRNIITDLDGQVDRVVVCDLKDNTFYAIIHLTVRGERVAIDARPSDAIALALRTRSPILVEENVIDSAKDRRLQRRAHRQRPSPEVAREPRP
jgi:MiaB/RimO family radical SAM methylthiotransferase